MGVNESKKVYVPPQNIRIELWEKTEKLYRFEEALTSVFRSASEELGRVLEHDKKEYWTRTVPQALHDFLGNYERAAVRAACLAWLEHNPEVAP